MANLTDMHVHIDYFEDYIQFFKAFEDKKIYALFVTNLPEIFKKCNQTFPSSKYVKLGLGFNPQLAGKYNFNKGLFDNLLSKTKYIGEVGLDYSNEFKAERATQRDAFEHISHQAGQLNKIMSIHSRKAEEDVLNILMNNNVKSAVFHWYTGKKETLFKILDQGYYFSVNYSMLNTKSGLEIIKLIPLDRLLIETDAPFGKTFISGVQYNLTEIYRRFSKKLGVESFEDQVFKNLSDLLLMNSK
ncbi:TatD family hydrolase [Niallia taxi]|uniref:TatD family hydrolase n=1 Tax=Niallia taxi TaxID=2499688 RepID=UPI003170DB86